MAWNYRIIKHVDKPPKSLEKNYPNGVVWYGMHSVYYDEKGNPNGCSQNTVQLTGDMPNELKKDMVRMLRAFDKPVLTYQMFLDQGKKKNEAIKSGSRGNKKRSSN